METSSKGKVVRVSLPLMLLLASGPRSAAALSSEGARGSELAPSLQVTGSPATTALPWIVFMTLSVSSDATNGCTGIVLTDRWILTAGHCLEGPTARVAIFGQSSASLFPLHDTPALARRHPDVDLGLVYLVDPLPPSRFAQTGRALLYRDYYQHPWCSARIEADRYFFLVGYGTGTDPGGSSDCDDGGVELRKRMGSYLLLNANDCGDNIVGAPEGAAHACHGDSGAPYLFQRDGLYLAFALHARSFPKFFYWEDQGTLIDPYSDWIFNVSYAIDSTNVLSMQTAYTPSGILYAWYLNADRSPKPPPTGGACPGGQRCCEAGETQCAKCIPAKFSCP